MYDALINSCPLFTGLSGDRLEHAFTFFGAQQKNYKRGEFFNRIGEPPDRFGLLLSGCMQVYMTDLDGNRVIMANVTAGKTFGESLCFLKRETAVFISAVTDCTVLSMTTDAIRLMPPSPSAEDIALANRFTAMLAERTLAMNNRIQILTKPSLRGKVLALLFQHISESGEKTVTLPFDRSDMAAYLGANRSALSRELSSMKKDGIIDYRANVFRLL